MMDVPEGTISDVVGSPTVRGVTISWNELNGRPELVVCASVQLAMSRLIKTTDTDAIMS